MKINANRMLSLMIVIIMATALLNACSSLPFMPKEETLKERVEGLMNAKINNNWGKVYTYFDPSYKKSISKETFLAKKREIQFIKFAIESINVEASRVEATVKIKYDVIMRGFKFKDSFENQRWIKNGRKWYMQATPPETSKIFG